MKKKKIVLISLISACAVISAGVVAITAPKKNMHVIGEHETYKLMLDDSHHIINGEPYSESKDRGVAITNLGSEITFEYTHGAQAGSSACFMDFWTSKGGEVHNVDPINGLVKVEYRCSQPFTVRYGFSPDNLRFEKQFDTHDSGHDEEAKHTFTFDNQYGYSSYFRVECPDKSQLFDFNLTYTCVASVDPFRIDGNWEYEILSGGFAKLTKFTCDSADIPSDGILTVPLRIGDNKVVHYVGQGALDNVPWVKHIVIPFVGLSFYSDEGSSNDFGSIFRSSNPPGDISYVPVQQHSNTWFIPKNLKTITLISYNRHNYDPDKGRQHFIPDYSFYGLDQINQINIYGPTSASESQDFMIDRIGEYAFANCTNLKELRIPYSIKTIDANAFAGNPDLLIRSYGSVSITDEMNPNYARVTENYLETISYEGITYDLYKSGDNTYANAIGFVSSSAVYLRLDNNIVIGNKTYVCRQVANRAFADSALLERIYLPSGMEKVGHLAFKGAYKASIILGETPSSDVYQSDWNKDTGVFAPNYTGGESFEQLSVNYLPLSSGYFADYIVGLPTNLELDQFDINLPVYVAAYFAKANSSITSLSLPKNITLGDYSFYGCNNLQILQYAGTTSEWSALVDAGRIGVNSFANTKVTQVICNGGSLPITLAV